MYADEIASWFDPGGRITGPGGDGRVSLTYRPELAEAIAVLLADPTHDDRRVVTVTGPESFSLAELAAAASEVTGDAYRYAAARPRGVDRLPPERRPSRLVDRGRDLLLRRRPRRRGGRRDGRLPRVDGQEATLDPRDDRAPSRRDAARAGGLVGPASLTAVGARASATSASCTPPRAETQRGTTKPLACGLRALSSVGRAPARQAGGHWFEPSSAHAGPGLLRRPFSCLPQGSPRASRLVD